MNIKSDYQVHESQNTCVLKVLTKASYTNCEPVRIFFDQQFESGKKTFIVDFDNCSSVDSTFLGILVGLALKLRSSDPKGKLILVNLRERNLQTVKNLGIHRIAQVSSFKVNDKKDLINLNSEKLEKAVDSETIHFAHKTLMELNAKNLKVFCDVVSFLEKDLERNR